MGGSIQKEPVEAPWNLVPPKTIALEAKDIDDIFAHLRSFGEPPGTESNPSSAYHSNKESLTEHGSTNSKGSDEMTSRKSLNRPASNQSSRTAKIYIAPEEKSNRIELPPIQQRQNQQQQESRERRLTNIQGNNKKDLYA